MKTKWYRRIGGKHIKFNLSKSGVTTSFKLGPITINPQRNSYFIKTGIPGLSLRGKLTDMDNQNQAINKSQDEQEAKNYALGLTVVIWAVAIFLFGLIIVFGS